MIRIEEFILRINNEGGIHLRFDIDKMNIIHGSNTIGKSIIIRSIMSTLGVSSAKNFILEKNFKGSDVKIETYIKYYINGQEIETKMIAQTKNGVILDTHFIVKTYKSKWIALSTTEMSEKMQALFKYPTFVSWQENGRKTLWEDIYSYIWIDQEKWKKDSFHEMVQMKYKHSNRLAAAAMFLKGNVELKKYSEKYQPNEELFLIWAKTLSIKKINERIDSLVDAKIESYDKDEKIEELISKIERIKALRKEMYTYKILIKGRKNELRIGSDTQMNILKSNLENKKIDNKIIDEVLKSIQVSWMSISAGDIFNERIDELNSMYRKSKSELAALEEKLSLFTSNELSNSEAAYIKEKLKTSLSDEISPEQEEFIKKAEEEWKEIVKEFRKDINKYLYSEINKVTIDNMNSNEILRRSFYTINNPGGTMGVNEDVANHISVSNYIDKDLLIIWDSIFSEDRGEEGDDLYKTIERKITFITEILKYKKFGILTMVSSNDIKEGLSGLEGVNSIFIEGAPNDKLISRELSEEAIKKMNNDW